jgi:hypothetical protein
MDELTCRVCGWPDVEPRWDESGISTFNICDCCGSEAGYQDCSPESARSNRVRWIAAGAPWFCKKSRPDDWEIAVQLRNVAVEYR